VVVHTVWHVLAGSAGRPHLPGWLRPRGRPTPKKPPKLPATQAAGDREEVTGIPGPEVDRPGRCRHPDPTYRPPLPGPGVGAPVLRVATQPPRTDAIDQALFAPTISKGEGQRTWAHGRSRSFPARLDHPTTGRSASLLSCGDVEANPGTPPTDWGEEDYAFVQELLAEACGRLGISPVRDAFGTPANHRFSAYWTREDGTFAQSWDYATAGPLWANPPFSRLEELVAKDAREGCLMLNIAPD